MLIYPAIDLKDGKCVRLLQGDFNKITTYGNDPVAVAQRWEASGAEWIHVVDLDGARMGVGHNSAVVGDIIKNVSVPVQIGGGIRKMHDVECLLNIGVKRVILGTAAVCDPGFVKQSIETYGDCIAVGIDAKGGYAAINGWCETSTQSTFDLCEAMCAIGVKTIIYTDIATDGMMTGPNIQAAARLADRFPINIIASGGVSCMEDIYNLSKTKCSGVIVGKALYEGAVDLSKAIKSFRKDCE